MAKKRTQNKFISRFDPKGKSHIVQGLLTAVAALFLLLGSFAQGLFCLYFSAGAYTWDLWHFYLSDPGLVCLNVLPLVLLAFVLWLLTNRPWIAFFTTGAVSLLYAFSAYWKVMIRSDPLFAEDLALVGEAAQISDGYLFFNLPMFLAVLFVALGTLLFFFFIRGGFPKWSVRLIGAALLVGLVIPTYFLVYTSDDIYESCEVWEELDPWIENNQYFSRGGIYPFLYSVKSAVPQPPEGYNEEDAVALLQSYDTDMIPEEQKVNVVIVMFEAFADFSDETDRITGGNPYADYQALRSQCYSGDLITNFYGGGTNNSERCVMTGFADLYRFRHPLWSYVQYFSDNGYVAQGSHSGNQSFYNRNTVNANMGFDEYWFYENRYEEMSDTVIVPDEIFLPDIADLALDKIEKGENVYSFNVTYQNHGPYATYLYDGSVEYVPQGDLTDEDYAVVNNYLNGVADTGKQMVNFVDTFRDCDEPVVLVMFGDHRPSMGSWGSTYEELGIPMYGEDDECFRHFYSTEYLIWGNDAAKAVLGTEFSGQGPTISPCFLMNVLFDQCGWEGPSYTKLTDEVMAALPVVTINDHFLCNGTFVSESELSSIRAELLQKMRCAQFYLAEDSNGQLP